MSTRGVIGFRKDGQDKVAYSRSDSYPSWRGVRVLAYCRTHTPAQMSASFDRITLVDTDTRPTPQQVEDHRDTRDTASYGGGRDEMYSLLIGGAGDLAYYDDPRHYLMIDYSGFLADSLFCEWAYVINLDEGVLEVYRGFNKDPRAAGRYAVSGRDEYAGVRLVETYPLSSLPSDEDFLAELQPMDSK